MWQGEGKKAGGSNRGERGESGLALLVWMSRRVGGRPSGVGQWQKTPGERKGAKVGVGGGKLGESSDKLSPIIGFLAQSSDRRATVRSQSGPSSTADGNLYYIFLLKNGLIFFKISGHGNLFEPSSTKNLGESSDTEAIHAHFCSKIHPIYQEDVAAQRVG